jgi:hypothetical protein
VKRRRALGRRRARQLTDAEGQVNWSLGAPYDTKLADRRLTFRRLFSRRRLRNPKKRSGASGRRTRRRSLTDAHCRDVYRPDADTGFRIKRGEACGRHATRWLTDAQRRDPCCLSANLGCRINLSGATGRRTTRRWPTDSQRRAAYIPTPTQIPNTAKTSLGTAYDSTFADDTERRDVYRLDVVTEIPILTLVITTKFLIRHFVTHICTIRTL